MSLELEQDEEAERALFGAVTAQLSQKDVQAPVPVAPAPKAGPEREPEPEPEDESEEAAPAVPAPRRGVDESLLAVLREEAAREAIARKAESQRGLETQTDLGLEDTVAAAGVSQSVRDRLARLRGPEAEPEPEITERPVARRDLLPDIEEINSTLRASSENRAGDVEPPPPPVMEQPSRTGFRSGFSLMMLVAVLMVVAYVAAPKISANLPAMAGPMKSYVAAVDRTRGWLDGAIRRATTGLQDLTEKDG